MEKLGPMLVKKSWESYQYFICGDRSPLEFVRTITAVELTPKEDGPFAEVVTRPVQIVDSTESYADSSGMSNSERTSLFIEAKTDIGVNVNIDLYTLQEDFYIFPILDTSPLARFNAWVKNTIKDRESAPLKETGEYTMSELMVLRRKIGLNSEIFWKKVEEFFGEEK